MSTETQNQIDTRPARSLLHDVHGMVFDLMDEEKQRAGLPEPRRSPEWSLLHAALMSISAALLALDVYQTGIDGLER